MRYTNSDEELVVHDVGVTFVDGEAEVSTKATTDTLQGLPANSACGPQRPTGQPTPQD